MKNFMKIRMIIYIISIILVALVMLGTIQTSCYFKDNFNIYCPACGLTRATISIVRFDFRDALSYNLYYTTVLIPLLLILVINDIWVFVKRFILKRKSISFIEIIFGERSCL